MAIRIESRLNSRPSRDYFNPDPAAPGDLTCYMHSPRINKAGFKQLTYRLYPKLYRIARVRLGNDQDAEDVVQDTYVKAFLSRDTLKDPAAVDAWLIRILINTIKDNVRRKAREPVNVPIDDLSDQDVRVLQTDTNPEHELASRELSPALSEALKAVPEIFLTPLVLREIHRASYQEIAVILSVPIGTVMSRLSRARNLLRKQLTAAQSSDREARASRPEMR